MLLAVDQRGSGAAKLVRRTSGPMVVWWGTQVEAASALARLVRESALPPSHASRVDAALQTLLRGAREVPATDAVRERACQLAKVHPLRAGDALQLAAALAWTQERPRGRVFVTFDARLADAGRAVGLDVRP